MIGIEFCLVFKWFVSQSWRCCRYGTFFKSIFQFMNNTLWILVQRFFVSIFTAFLRVIRIYVGTLDLYARYSILTPCVCIISSVIFYFSLRLHIHSKRVVNIIWRILFERWLKSYTWRGLRTRICTRITHVESTYILCAHPLWRIRKLTFSYRFGNIKCNFPNGIM